MYLIDIHRVIYVKKTLKKVNLWFVNLHNSRFLCNFASDNKKEVASRLFVDGLLKVSNGIYIGVG